MSIEILFDCIKKELMYQYYYKKYLIIIPIFILLIFFNVNMLINDTETHIKNYEKAREQHIDRGTEEEMNLLLKEEYKIEYKGNDPGVTNTIKYDLISSNISVQKFDIFKFISSNFEYILVILGTYIFYILGLNIAMYDYKNKTLKLKSNLKIINYTIGSKILILILYSIIAVIFISIFSVFVAPIGRYIISNKCDIDRYYIDIIKFNIPLFFQAFFCVLVLSIFSLIGFTIGRITKNKILSISIASIYFLLTSDLGKYDLRVIIATLSHRIFDFEGNFPLPNPYGNSISFSITYIVVLVLVLLLFNWILNRKNEIN